MAQPGMSALGFSGKLIKPGHQLPHDNKEVFPFQCAFLRTRLRRSSTSLQNIVTTKCIIRIVRDQGKRKECVSWQRWHEVGTGEH